MARIFFTQQLRRFIDAPEVQTGAGSLRLALEDAFEISPGLRGYILDDQGHLRAHVAVFVDGVRLKSRTQLDVALRDDSSVHVLQALSGG